MSLDIVLKSLAGFTFIFFQIGTKDNWFNEDWFEDAEKISDYLCIRTFQGKFQFLENCPYNF